MDISEATKMTDVEWKEYWEGFRWKYGSEDVLIREMVAGDSNDLYVKNAGEHLGVETGMQFGIKALVRDNLRKVEMRVVSWKQFEEYFGVSPEGFKEKLPEIVRRIKEIGGEYNPKNGDAVINCYFMVSGSTRDEYERVYEMFEEFKVIILDYYSVG